MLKNFILSLSAVLSVGMISCNNNENDNNMPAHQEITIKAEDLTGRWDLTLTDGTTTLPSWLEVKKSGIKTLVGYYVGVNGSARPVSEVKLQGDGFHFAIPPQWEEGDYLKVEGRFVNGGLEGRVTFPDGKQYNFTGERAPDLVRTGQAVYGEVVELFNGKDLSNWSADGESNWKVENGILINPKPGANIFTNEKFDDFKLFLEFRYPEGSNSGVYLRGRYEVQIMDSKTTRPSSVEFGGVYGFISPSEIASKGPGEWQTYEITLQGRMVTLVANGKTVIHNEEIPGITGGAIDSKEGEPGPILIQGDHGPVEFKRIAIQKISYK